MLPGSFRLLNCPPGGSIATHLTSAFTLESPINVLVDEIGIPLSESLLHTPGKEDICK